MGLLVPQRNELKYYADVAQFEPSNNKGYTLTFRYFINIYRCVKDVIAQKS